MSDSPKPVRIGQIVGAFGIRGQVKVEPLTDFVERFDKGSRLRVGDQWYEVETSTLHKGRPLIKLQGVNNATAAEALQWLYLEAIVEERPELEEDEFLVEDLVDLEVFTLDGKSLGKVDEVLSYPAQDILKIGSVLIPLVKEFVREIDLEAGRIVVEPIPGMLDDADTV